MQSSHFAFVKFGYWIYKLSGLKIKFMQCFITGSRVRLTNAQDIRWLSQSPVFILHF